VVGRGRSTSVLARRIPWSVVGQHAAVVVGTLFVIRVVAAGWRGGFPVAFPDSSSFLAVARRGPFSPRFWYDERPVGFPFLAWTFARNVRLIVLVQTLLYVAAFGTLAAVVWRSLRAPIARWCAVLLIASVGIQPRFALWNTQVLSESLTISLGVFTVAAWWWCVARPSSSRVAVAATTTAAWLTVRDSSLAPVVAVVFPALLASAFCWRRITQRVRRALLVAAGGLLVVGTYVAVSQAIADRYQYSLMNVVGQRVLLDASATEWFADHGMPLDETLQSFAGHDSWSDGEAMLRDGRLAEFRDWVTGSGERTRAVSLVAQAPFWLGGMFDDDQLPATLRYDFADYDTFGVSDRLPDALPGLAGPRSLTALAVWMALATVGLGAAMLVRRLRPFAVVTGVGIVATAVDLYVSYAADSVEVSRHLVGALSRVTLLLFLGLVLLVERVAAGSGDTATLGPDEQRRRQPVAAYGLTALVTALGAAALFGNELRSQEVDPQYMRVLVDRAARFGGTYYANGIHNKGPLEPLVYDVSRWLGGDDGGWLVVSAIIAAAALVVGAVVYLTARAADAGRALAAVIAGGAIIHLTLSQADYAGTFYSRQMTVTLLAAAWGIAIVDGCWVSSRRAAASAVAIGVLTGLAVQTLQSAVFAAAVVVVTALAGVARRAVAFNDQPWHRWPRATALIALSGVATVLAPVGYYAVRGGFDEFWSGWWTYAGYSSSATGRSLAGQLGLAWHQAYLYYQRFPLSAAVLGGCALLAALLWRDYDRRQRQLRLGIAAWILAAWLELALSQRYSSHYFSVLAVPTWLAFAVATADVARMVRARRPPIGRPAVASLLALLVFVFIGGFGSTIDGLARASRFTGLTDLTAQRRAGREPPLRAEQAVLDLVTSPGDPMLTWTMGPWTYLDHDRVSATRFIWKSFLVGEVYLARSGPQYVLPHTWEWFADDLAEARPLVEHEEVDVPIDPSTPFATYVDEHFDLTYRGSRAAIRLHQDVGRQLRAGGTGHRRWVAVEELPGGWTTTPGRLEYSPEASTATTQPVALGRGWCRRVDGSIDRTADAAPSLELVVQAPDGQLLGHLHVDATTASSSGATDPYDATAWSWPGGTVPVRFAVVTGDRSVVLLVGDAIAAAIPIDQPDAVGRSGPVISVVGAGTALRLTALSTAASGPLGSSGCD
jgi:hypothetical protein